jgi:hypothetical protein
MSGRPWRTGPRPEFTKLDLVLHLRQLAERLGRVPRIADVAGLRPSAYQYVAGFGTWTAALTAAGLPLRNHRPCKLTPAQREEIRRRYIPPSPGNQRELAAEFGISAVQVSIIGRRRAS